MSREADGVEAIALLLDIPHLLQHFDRQSLSDEIRQYDGIGIAVVLLLHPLQGLGKTGGEIGAALEAAAEKTQGFLQTLRPGQLIADHVGREELNDTVAPFIQGDLQQGKAERLGCLFRIATHGA